MNEEFVADIWMLFKEYLDKKHIELAAEKYVDTLIDYGLADDQLQEMLGTDKHLDYAIQYYLEMDHQDIDDYNEWDEILRVNNEDVIEDLDGQVRRMLDYLELPFEDQCIAFHETDRSVRTASSEQVRQPINKKGMGRWKPYAKHLRPLLDHLDKKLLKPEDIALIK